MYDPFTMAVSWYFYSNCGTGIPLLGWFTSASTTLPVSLSILISFELIHCLKGSIVMPAILGLLFSWPSGFWYPALCPLDSPCIDSQAKSGSISTHERVLDLILRGSSSFFFFLLWSISYFWEILSTSITHLLPNTTNYYVHFRTWTKSRRGWHWTWTCV